MNFPKLKTSTALFKHGIGAGFFSVAYCIGPREFHTVFVPGCFWDDGEDYGVWGWV